MLHVHTKFRENRLPVQEKMFSGFYHIWAAILVM